MSARNVVSSFNWRLSDLPKRLDGPKVFSTFSCGGGSSMGYKLAGCNVLGGNDIDPVMAEHYKMNLNPSMFYTSPIRKLVDGDVDPALYSLDILDGSPPCSTFSISGNREKDWGKAKKFREGQHTQVLSDLFFDWIELVGKLRPKVAIAENVSGMLKGNAKGYVKAIISALRALGYKVQVFLVDAANCGVAQVRKRVFFCCVRQDVSTASVNMDFKLPVVTANQAIAHLPALSDKEVDYTAPRATDKRYWPTTKPGSSFSEAARNQTGKNKLFNFVKLHPDKPACTIAAVSGLYTHWFEMRRLSFAELKCLSSFPQDYQAKSFSLGSYLIGMSVPPFMAKCVAERCIAAWL